MCFTKHCIALKIWRVKFWVWLESIKNVKISPRQIFPLYSMVTNGSSFFEGIEANLKLYDMNIARCSQNLFLHYKKFRMYKAA